MLMRPRTMPVGFIQPCLPIKAPRPPVGAVWLHEIKHDGFRVIARKDGARVRLYSRPGNDLTRQFPLIVEAMARLRSHSCIIDGEAVACEEKTGIACFATASGITGSEAGLTIARSARRTSRLW
jgi:ATP-dependent DNA ligase